MEDDIQTIADSLGVKRKHVVEMTVGDLKEECSERGIKVSGKKHDLVERLARSMRGKSLPTDKGKKRKETDSNDKTKTKKAKTTLGPMPQGIPSHLQKELDIKSLQKYYKDECRDFHKMVNADWHDGWEEQGKYLSDDYFPSLTKSAKAICELLSAPTISEAVIKHCYEVTLVLADSVDLMSSVPMRGEVRDALWSNDTLKIGTSSKKLDSISSLLNFLFENLLFRAIEVGMERGQIMSMIKGAMEYGYEADDDEKSTERVNAKKLQELIAAKKEWEGLASRKNVYKEKGVIDRRFSGPKHKRTRDFGDSDDDRGEDCIIC
jgi:hypothetical protein